MIKKYTEFEEKPLVEELGINLKLLWFSQHVATDSTQMIHSSLIQQVSHSFTMKVQFTMCKNKIISYTNNFF